MKMIIISQSGKIMWSHLAVLYKMGLKPPLFAKGHKRKKTITLMHDYASYLELEDMVNWFMFKPNLGWNFVELSA